MKKLRFTIANKITGGFITLIVIFAINATVSFLTLDKSNSIIKENAEVINPSMSGINDFVLLVTRSKMLITNWVFLRSNTEDKEALKFLMGTEYPQLKDNLQNLMKKWKDEGQRHKMDSIFDNFEELLTVNDQIMKDLVNFEDYDDFNIKFLAEDAIESQVLPQTAALISQLETIKKIKKDETDKAQISLLSSFDDLRQITLILGIIIISIGILGALLMARSITKPIIYIKKIIAKLGKGELPSEDNTKFTRDEVGEMAEAVMTLVKGLKSTTFFAESIGNGNYDADYKPLSEHDVLGNALIEMRNNLKKVSDEDKRRNWATEGLARFGEILRKNNDNITRLSDEIISNLIKYLGANQGGLYIVNEDGDEKFLSLAACYAWDKKKYLDQKVYEGDGLTGQAWIEKDIIYLTEVPDDYIKITSGLGEANPSSILIVPLKVNDEVFGVLEIASFQLFEEHEMEFVEKIAESIASTISSVKINERTQKLLEESQEMTEQMRSQEEEMRQNMEELQATQEEMERGQRDREYKENIINSTTMLFELDEDFRIKSINQVVTDTLKFSSNEVMGKLVDSLIASTDNFNVAKSHMNNDKIWTGILNFKTNKNNNITTKVSAGKAHDPYDGSDKYLIFASEISNVVVS
jgi:putative methionine-R-sulfoxide reductase with GAF domain/HAMP domain-containing protein